MIKKLTRPSSELKKASVKIWVMLLVISLLLTAFIIYDNFRVAVKTYSLSSDKIPDAIHGYKIAHVSDYHNRKSRLVNYAILESLREEQPDIIVFTGDSVDSEKPDFSQSLSFMRSLQNIAQVYFVTGNHEYRLSMSHSDQYTDYINEVANAGVIILENETVELFTENGDSIYLHGIIDPYFTECGPTELSHATDALCSELDLKDGYNILIAHQPEQMSVYTEYGFDLVLSGHAHGGQVTFFGIPIKAPDQSGFPKYAQGLYESGDTELIISRGIGYSVLPIRVFCSPQLVYVELNS